MPCRPGGASGPIACGVDFTRVSPRIFNRAAPYAGLAFRPARPRSTPPPGHLAGRGPWSAAVDHGLDYLIGRYRRSDGLFRGAVDLDGVSVDETAALYDQAFVLLALATAARARPDRAAELRDSADAVATRIRATYGLTGGGYRADDRSNTYLQNPIMHLFEAVLAWAEISGPSPWSQWADDLAAFFHERLWNSETGAINEVFDEHWRPLLGPHGCVLEPGHQFEWAWLIDRWSRAGGGGSGLATPASLYASGDRGVEPRSGLVVDEISDQGAILKGSSRLWPQTERLKAALVLASAGGEFEPRGLAAAHSALAALEMYLTTPVEGLWRDAPASIGASIDPPAPASSFYHILGAIVVLSDWAGLSQPASS